MKAKVCFTRLRGLACGCILCWPSTAVAESWRVTVQGTGIELEAVPILVELELPVPAGNFDLKSDQGGKAMPANVFRDDGKTFLGMILDRVPANKSLTFTLRARPDTKGDSSRGVDFEEKHDLAFSGGGALRRQARITASIGSKPLFVYLADDGPKPYYFPVVGPPGAAITRSYPMRNVPGEEKDHPHQRSMWFTHGNVNGIDFWASDPLNPPRPNYGKIKMTALKTRQGGDAVGVLRTTDDWLGPDGKKICEDERVVRVHAANSPRVFDFDVTIKATNGPVTFGDTKEGMFGIRVASSMDVKRKTGGKITNAEGLTDDAAWGKASPWVDYVGPVEGRTVGVAILNHPDSFRYPTTWHVRTYGLFAANPFGWHDFGMKKSGAHTIPAGQSIRFRYRVVLHAGDAASAQIPALFKAYSSPPAVAVKAE